MSSTVFPAFSRLLLVSLLMVSISLHLVCLQVVAWSGMWIGFIRQGDRVGQAISKTFDGHHACRICSFVRSSSTQSPASEEKLPIQKIELSASDPCFRWDSPRLQKDPPLPFRGLRTSRSFPPPVPPPRPVVA